VTPPRHPVAFGPGSARGSRPNTPARSIREPDPRADFRKRRRSRAKKPRIGADVCLAPEISFILQKAHGDARSDRTRDQPRT